jgi:hypothetical protein
MKVPLVGFTLVLLIDLAVPLNIDKGRPDADLVVYPGPVIYSDDPKSSASDFSLPERP